MTSSPSASFSWPKAAVLASPSLALAGVAAILGATTAIGALCLCLAFIYLGLALIVLQQKFGVQSVAPLPDEHALESFLQGVRHVSSAEELTEELSLALSPLQEGRVSTSLVSPNMSGEIVIASSTPTLNGLEVGERGAAFRWLGDSMEPIWRYQLESIQEEGAVQTAEMMDMANARVLVPLHHRGDLLGLLLISTTVFDKGNYAVLLRGLQTHSTTALANTFLGAEATGKAGVAKTLGLANAIQESLMPEERPVRRAGWELVGLFRPVAACGGDLWGWSELSPNRVLLVIADATGHGAGPALLSAVAKGTFDGYALSHRSDCDPAELLAAMNKAVLRVGQRAFMMTAFAVVFDMNAGTMVFANAGQNFPFLLRDDKLQALVVRGDQLGALESPEIVSHTRKLIPGDKVFLYTDGIVEAGEPMSEPFGDRRFRRLIQKMGAVAAIDIPGRVIAEVEEFLEGNAVHDDITMVSFEADGKESQEL